MPRNRGTRMRQQRRRQRQRWRWRWRRRRRDAAAGIGGGGRIPPALRAAAKAVAKTVAPGPRRVSNGGDVGPGTACALCSGGCAIGVGKEATGSARVGVGGGVGVVPTRAGSMVAAE